MLFTLICLVSYYTIKMMSCYSVYVKHLHKEEITI